MIIAFPLFIEQQDNHKIKFVCEVHQTLRQKKL